MVYEKTKPGELVNGIWAKAFAFSEGNLEKAKAKYITLRAEQVLNEAHKNLLLQQTAEKEQAEKMDFIKTAAT